MVTKNNKFLADIIIPCYNEKGYIERTLSSLTQQTLYREGKLHIALGDFKNELNMEDTYLYDLTRKFKNVTYLPIFYKGIAYARNTLVSDATKTDIIVNFDADSMFNTTDAIEKLIDPIINKEALLTNCETVFYDFENNKAVDKDPSNIYEYLSNLGSKAERFIFARGPGLTVRKDAFFSVGGFRLVPVGEDYFMAWDICVKHGYQSKKFIDKIKVLTSNRRSSNYTKDGLNVFNYEANSYR